MRDIPSRYLSPVKWPRQLIGLQEAVEKVVAQFDAGLVTELTVALQRGEQDAWVIGGGPRTTAWKQSRERLMNALKEGTLELLIRYPDTNGQAKAVQRRYWRSPDDAMIKQVILTRGKDDREGWEFVLDDAVFSAWLTEASSGHKAVTHIGAAAINTPQIWTIERIEEWIFDQHSQPPLSQEKLLIAFQRDQQHRSFKKTDFVTAYGNVYVTKPHRPPLSGWLLQPKYRNRAREKKSSE